MHKRANTAGNTFNDILEQAASANSLSLMERARVANRLAKTVEGRSKSMAYAVKHRALRALTVRFPTAVRIKDDPIHPGLVIIRPLAKPWGLHAPKAVFAEPLQSVIAA